MAYKKTRIILIMIFLLSFLIRIYNLKDNTIFAYDQPRDATRIYEMLFKKDFKIVGPETDIPGIFNGPLFYYILAPVYYISNFDPNFASLFMIFINLSGIFILYLLAKILFKNEWIGIIAAFLWGISYFQLNFSRFISNASPLSITTAIFFLGWALYLFKNKKNGLLISALGLGAATHFDVYLLYLILLYPIFFFLYKNVKIQDVIKSILLLGLTLITFFIAEIKWKFMGIKSLLNYFMQQQTSQKTIIESLSRYLERLTEAYNYSFFSFNNFLAFILISWLIILGIKLIKDKKIKTFSLIWLFSTLPLFSFSSGVLSGPVISTSIIPIITLLVAAGIYSLTKTSYLVPGLILSIFTISNFTLALKDNFTYTHMIAKEPLLYKYEKQVIDYTYKTAQGEKFSVCALTNPLFINTLWSFLYKMYGEKNYGYLPYWSGQKQYLNPSYLPYDKNHVKTRYLILEPMIGIPEYSKKATVFLEDHISTLKEEKKFGTITVQKRVLRDKPLKITKKELEKSGLKAVLSADPRYSCFIEY